MNKTWIGIDPGQKGAIAVLDSEEPASVIDMPLLPDGDIDPYVLFKLLASMNPSETYAILEKAQAMPKQGVTGIFTYGQGYGTLLTVLRLASIPFVEVRPLKWKKYYSLGKDKRQVVTCAMNLYPDIEYFRPQGGMKDGRAEAILIAHYGKEGNA